VWVVGLGNPGRRYAGTRHNVGHAVVGVLTERWRTEPLARERAFHAYRAAPGGPAGAAATLIAPQAFMNRSGEALAAFAAATGERPVAAETLVVCDDVYLPVGYLRLRARGSTGGHRGLASVQEFFGTADFPRLRIGVGEAAGEQLMEHVLSEFDARDEESVREALASAADAVETWLREGILAAMNRFNRRVREVGP
jgi:peptidyl-tRNA hydrolase, PTH1 family